MVNNVPKLLMNREDYICKSIFCMCNKICITDTMTFIIVVIVILPLYLCHHDIDILNRQTDRYHIDWLIGLDTMQKFRVFSSQRTQFRPVARFSSGEVPLLFLPFPTHIPRCSPFVPLPFSFFFSSFFISLHCLLQFLFPNFKVARRSGRVL